MEPVNFMQSSSLGINQEFVSLSKRGEMEDFLSLDNDFVSNEKQTSLEEKEDEDLLNTEDIAIPKTDSDNSFEQIAVDNVSSNYDSNNESNEKTLLKMETSSEDVLDKTFESVENKQDSECTELLPSNEMVNNISFKEFEDLPKLIPIKSKRQENEVPCEMPSLIPITKHNNRLAMAQFIERKLQSEIEDYNYIEIHSPVNSNSVNMEIENESIEEEIHIVVSDTSSDQESELFKDDPVKIPLVGSVCKSDRKTCRLTKPPWLTESNSSEPDNVEDVSMEFKDEDMEVDTETHHDETESNLGTTPITNGMDMREKLCSQLQMLKVKKKTEPLIQTNILNFSSVHHEKKKIKPPPIGLNIESGTSSPLGIKIVAVAGGVDMDNLMSMSIPLNDLQEDNISDEVSSNSLIETDEAAINNEKQEALIEDDNILINEKEIFKEANGDGEEILCVAKEEDIVETLQTEDINKSSDDSKLEIDVENILKKEVIINEHLDQPLIKLTKTKDYKKIKGWNKKKLLTLDDKSKVALSTSKFVTDEQKPSCSYTQDNENVNKSIIPETFESKPAKSTEANNIFASNSLDGFLEEKDLNISYNVPNLKSQNHNINLLDDCVLVGITQITKTEVKIEADEGLSNSSFKDAYKPRTLAEKRKMMLDEKDGIENKRMKRSKNKEKKFSRRSYTTKYETDPVKDKETKEPQENESLLVPLISNVPNIIRDDYSSDVLLLNEEQSKPKNSVISKIRFRSKTILAPYSVVTRKPLKKIYYSKYQDIKRKIKYDLVPKTGTGAFTTRYKPSILKSPVSPIEYRPGPLCKKQELQIKVSNTWETVLVDLPKVEVQVTPELKKKIHPRVRQFVKFDTFDISENRADFALSALVTTKQQKKSFSFPTKYKHNQEKLLMRRKIVKPTEETKCSVPAKRPIETDTDIMTSVQMIMGKMLDYVEVKEVECTLFKYDEDIQYKPETDTDTEPLEEMTKQRKSWAGLDKSSRELRRLSVRIVDLPNEEKTETHANCNNEFCKYGCVCQSIATNYPPFNHCGESKCIFECICGFEANCKYNIDKQENLDEGTLSRFSKEAKRNITAREEREFTQTAIRSNNNTIIVGNNRINKRRPKYNFKRFEGYQFSFSDDKIPKNAEDAWMFEDDKVLMSDWKLYNCSVALVRCDFDDIIPFCLVHNLYDCHCGGKSEYTHYDQFKISKQAQKISISTLEEESNNDLDVEAIMKLARRTPRQIQTVFQSKTNENTVSNAMGLSSRIRGTGEYYRTRNNTNRFKNIMARKLKYDTTVDPEIVNKWIILPPDHNVVEKRKLQQQAKLASLNSNETIVVDDDSPDSSEALRKKANNVAERKSTIQPSLRNVAARLTLSGALYTPTPTMCAQFSQMITDKNKTAIEFRLLMWSPLVKLYQNEIIRIWHSNKNNKIRFIITDSISNPIDSFENIKIFEGLDKNEIKVDFIRWIVTKTMPDKKNGNNTLVILKILANCWEICGICAKNKQNESPKAISKQDTDISEETTDCNNDVNIVDSDDRLSDSTSQKNLNTNSIKEEKDDGDTNQKYTPVRHVVFSSGTFASKRLQLMDLADKSKGQLNILAALPHVIKNCRWRVLLVNSNFNILSFTKNKFSIKCSDILTVMKVSTKYNKTIIINTKTNQKYKHNAFGIYIPSSFQDRIFIGPYVEGEDHGIKTLRFVNNKLVDTEVFNEMRGVKNSSCTGLWYTQIGRVTEPNQIQESVTSDCVIDLTDMEEVRKVMQSSENNSVPSVKPISPKVLAKQALLKGTSTKIQKPSTTPANSLTVSNSEQSSVTSYQLDNNITVKVPKSTEIFPQNSTKHLAPRLLIPTISADNKVTYSEVMINVPPGVNFVSNMLGTNKPKVSTSSTTTIQQVSPSVPAVVPTVVAPKGTSVLKNNLLKKCNTSITPTTKTKPNVSNREKIPELIKIALQPNKINKNITQVKVKENMDVLMDVATLENIIEQSKTCSPERREYLFKLRLSVLMNQMDIALPLKAKPFCFRLNFGNGIILGYEHNDVIHVFWPGDCKRQFEFDDMEEAISWLKQELHAVFICIPTTFRIFVSPVGPSHYLEYMNRGIISQKYFKEICIIGDFGIMRLSEAQIYLIQDDCTQALKLLQSHNRPTKFKRAMSQIITSNDMSKGAFQRKVTNLIRKAKAAADDFAQFKSAESQALNDKPPVLKKEKSVKEEVICLDSDSDDNVNSDPSTSNPYNRTFHRLQKRLNKHQKKKAKKVEKETMQLDLTNLTTARVKSLLSRSNSDTGMPLHITEEQVNQLKAIARESGALHQ